jgi:hypothetical protein
LVGAQIIKPRLFHFKGFIPAFLWLSIRLSDQPLLPMSRYPTENNRQNQQRDCQQKNGQRQDQHFRFMEAFIVVFISGFDVHRCQAFRAENAVFRIRFVTFYAADHKNAEVEVFMV